jgi:hypothetical protein
MIINLINPIHPDNTMKSTLKYQAACEIIKYHILSDNPLRLSSHYIPMGEAGEILQPDLMALTLAEVGETTTHLCLSGSMIRAAHADVCMELFGEPRLPVRKQAYFLGLLEQLGDSVDWASLDKLDRFKAFDPTIGCFVKIPQRALSLHINKVTGSSRVGTYVSKAEKAAQELRDLDIDMI